MKPPLIPCPYQHTDPFHEFCWLCHGTMLVEQKEDYRVQSLSINDLHVGNRLRLMVGYSLLPEDG